MWIATNESRVRVEARMISGEQYDVWNWIQPEPPPTEVDMHIIITSCMYIVYMYLIVYGG